MKLLCLWLILFCSFSSYCQVVQTWLGASTTRLIFSSPTNAGFGLGADIVFLNKVGFLQHKKLNVRPIFGFSYQTSDFEYYNNLIGTEGRVKQGFGTANLGIQVSYDIKKNYAHVISIGCLADGRFGVSKEKTNNLLVSQSTHAGFEYGGFLQLTPSKLRWGSMRRYPRTGLLEPSSVRQKGRFVPPRRKHKLGFRLSYSRYSNNKSLAFNGADIGYNYGLFKIGLLFNFGQSRVVSLKKPAVYFYPEKEQMVQLKVVPNGQMVYTYPTFQDTISFEANPAGDITHDSISLAYVFWESNMSTTFKYEVYKNGFIVQRMNYLSFIRKSIEEIGLNDKESNQFITFWLPELMKYSSCFIHFKWQEECQKFAQIEVDPKPDNMNRLYMLFYPNPDANLTIEPQRLPYFNRTGFDVLEWGGMEIPAPLP